MNKINRFAAVALAAGAMTAATSLPASATTVIPAQENRIVYKETISQHDLGQAFRELEKSPLPRAYDKVDDTTLGVFQLSQGLSLTLPDPDTIESIDSGTQRLGAGKKSNGYWISFNQFDQNTLSNVFISAALTGAICAVPGVGGVVCALAGVAISIGVSYVHKNGVCSGNRQLYWYDVKGGSTMGCRSSAPK